METGVQLVWWIGLVLALGLTAVLLKLVFLVLRTLRDIQELAGWIARAAEGLAAAMARPRNHEEAAENAERLRLEAARLVGSLAGIRRSAAGGGEGGYGS